MSAAVPQVSTSIEDAELAESMRRSDERRERFRVYLEKALADPDNIFRFDEHPFPWTAQMVIWDGPGVQFFDANSKPVLGDLLRDQDDAAILLDLCNTTGIRGAAQAAPVRVDDHMIRARRLVENHIEAYGMVPHPDFIKDAISDLSQQSFDLGFRAAGGSSPLPSTDREYDPNVAPCDDAEFGMKP